MKVSVVTVAPTIEPVTLSDAKSQLRISADNPIYDLEVSALIVTARTYVERRYGLSIITQSRQQRQDSFYEDSRDTRRSDYSTDYSRFVTKLLNGPVQSVSSVTYVDEDGATQTLSPSAYTTTGMVTPVLGSAQDVIIGGIYPVDVWPDFKLVSEAIKITYVCGFGNSGAYVPATIKQAILKTITHLFEYRSDEALTADLQQLVKFEMGVDRLMSSYEVFEHVNMSSVC